MQLTKEQLAIKKANDRWMMRDTEAEKKKQSRKVLRNSSTVVAASFINPVKKHFNSYGNV